MQEQNPALTSAPMPTTAPVSPSSTLSNFDVTQATPKKKLPLKMILGVLVLILLVVGAGAGYYLTQINQDVRQQASGCVYGTCGSSGQTQCVSGKTHVCIAGCWQDSGTTCTAPSPVVGPTTLLTCWSSSCSSLKTTASTCPANFSTTKPLVCGVTQSGCAPGQVSTGCSGFLKN